MLLEGEQKVLYQNSSGKVQEFDYGDGRIKASFCVVGGSFFFLYRSNTASEICIKLDVLSQGYLALVWISSVKCISV